MENTEPRQSEMFEVKHNMIFAILGILLVIFGGIVGFVALLASIVTLAWIIMPFFIFPLLFLLVPGILLINFDHYHRLIYDNGKFTAQLFGHPKIYFKTEDISYATFRHMALEIYDANHTLLFRATKGMKGYRQFYRFLEAHDIPIENWAAGLPLNTDFFDNRTTQFDVHFDVEEMEPETREVPEVPKAEEVPKVPEEPKVDPWALEKQLEAHQKLSLNPEISTGLKETIELLKQIINLVEKNGPNEKIEKLYSYYLPSLLKILGQYEAIAELEDNPNTLVTKNRVIQMIDLINGSMKKIAESLLEQGYTDLSSDLQTLEAVLQKDGLTDDTVNQSQKQ